MRAVDGDTGDTDPFLQNLEPDDELDAAAGVKLAGADAEEHVEVALLVGGLVFEVADGDDVLQLGLGGDAVLALVAAKAAEDKAGFLLAAGLDEPTGRLRHEPDEAEEEDERQDLECDGEAPDEGGVGVVVLGGAELEPVGDDDTEDVEGELEGDKLAAGGVGGGLGGPDGGDGVEDAGTDAVEDAGAEHPVGVHGGRLQGSSEDAPDAGTADGGDAAVAVAEPAAEEAAEESSGEVVDGDLRDDCVSDALLGDELFGESGTYNAALQERLIDDDNLLLIVPVAEAHELGIVAGGVDTAHQTLVVTKEEDGQASDEADGVEQLALVQLVGDIVLGQRLVQAGHDCGMRML